MPANRSLPFLSPLAKLVTFFHGSRDKWKEKCKAAKRQNKSLKLCLAKMKESRDRWKADAMASQEGPKNSRLGKRKQRRAGLGFGRAGGLHHEGAAAPVPPGCGGRQLGFGTARGDAPQTCARGADLELELVG
jgi:hypothetical protein